ncbi:MAG TPA: HAMP domain-containing sensor histidine kinase [Anaerolineaceae bacterium]|nr:HAMP domain-containing sensor histidine kinase [Anaerolineaceae bacterium]
MNLRSIRWRLSLTYAGLALLTALALGGVLLFVLRGYYADQERIYLRGNALSLGDAVGPILESNLPKDSLQGQINLFAILSQVRVRLLDENGKLLVESQKPAVEKGVFISAVSGPDILYRKPALEGRKSTPASPQSPGSVLAEPAAPAGPPERAPGGVTVLAPYEWPFVGRVTGSGPVTDKLQLFYSGDPALGPKTLVSVIPIAGTMYGFSLQGDFQTGESRSDQVVSQPIVYNGRKLGSIELSDGPSYGREIVIGVARGWLLASLAAVLLAAGVGWLISRRLSAPLLGLVEVTRKMSTGDLSIRAGEAEGLSHQDEFGLLAQTFNEMAGQVENTVGTLRSFVSDAAHELNTPLTALRTNLELAGVRGDPAVERAREQVERLQSLTGDLLDLSRIESGSNGEREPVDLRGMVAEISEVYASQAEQKEIDFELDLPAETAQDLQVSVHSGRLRRVVENLLENALKFTPAGGRVRLSLERIGDQARITVSDSGIGIPPEDQALLFGRFHRGRNTAGYPGSGLGLAIVKAILDQYGGGISLIPQEKGTCFEVMIPLVGSGN